MIRPSRRHLRGAPGRSPALSRVMARERPYWPISGWRQIMPAEVGVDPAILDEVTARIQSEAPSLSAMVVAFGGNLLDEYYADGFLAHQATDIWSSTRSITGTAVGIAIVDGLMTLKSRLPDPERRAVGRRAARLGRLGRAGDPVPVRLQRDERLRPRDRLRLSLVAGRHRRLPGPLLPGVRRVPHLRRAGPGPRRRRDRRRAAVRLRQRPVPTPAGHP